MTGDTDSAFLVTPDRRIVPGSVIEFVHPTRRHGAGERYRFTGDRRGAAGRFAGCSPTADRFVAFAPSRLYRWLEEGTVRLAEPSAGGAAQRPVEAGYASYTMK